MANNLSTIGFEFADEQEMLVTLTELAGRAVEMLATRSGEYAIWRSRTGAEIWFHLGPQTAPGQEREIVGLTPCFQGRSEARVKLTRAVQRPTDNAFEGAFTAWMSPDEETGEGCYPLAFEAADFAAHAGCALPAVRRVQLVAFARELKAFRSGADYEARQTSEPRLAAKAFVPIGLLAAASAEGESDAPPEGTSASHVLLTGRVKETSRLVNEATGRAFVWVLVESLEATFDVVADPEVVGGEIIKGGAVEVMAALFGRILD